MFPFIWDHFKTEHQGPVLGLSHLRASAQWGDKKHPVCWQCSGTDRVSSSPLEKAGQGLSYPQYCAKVGAKKASIHNYFKNNAELSCSSSNVFCPETGNAVLHCSCCELICTASRLHARSFFCTLTWASLLFVRKML